MSAASLSDLRRQILACRRCPLAGACRAPVPGEGTLSARVLVLGEAPGATEDAVGRPFIGRSGQLLRALLADVDLLDLVYIGNTVRCRPPDNRTPSSLELAACLPHLQAEVALVRPDVMLVLGKTSLRATLGRRIAASRLADLRGWYDGPADSDLLRALPLRPRIFVTYHPSAALRATRNRERLAADLAALAESLRAA